MDSLLQDLRHGFRMLLRTRLLSLVAVLTIGLGIGSTSFAFSVVYGTLLRGLPVRDADRLMVITQARPEEGTEGMRVPLHDYHELRDRQTSFEHLAAAYSGTVNLAGDEGPPERYQGAFVSARLLSMLAVTPVHGRGFVEGDDTPGAPPLVLLGYAVWRNRFGADPGVVGRTARVNGETATIIGVMPEGFRFPFAEDLWVPLRVDPNTLPRRGGTPLLVTGYLREGVSREAAQAEIASIAEQLASEHPDENSGLTAEVSGYTEEFMPPQISVMMLLLVAMVAGVLLVACANVANVLLARAVVREREVAIRSALGARRWRVVRQLLAEAVALGVVGGLLGIVGAWFGLRAFEGALVDVQRPYWIVFRLDAVSLLFTTAVTLAAAVAAGTVPALRASGGGLDTVLRDESRGSSGLRLGRFSTGLVVGELAVSCGLMIGAGLLIRSLVDLNRLDLGFTPENVATARLGLFETDYPDPDARSRFYHAYLERLTSEPGVIAATLTTALPATGQGQYAVQVEGRVYETPADVPAAGGAVVTPGFFDTFGVRLLEGRDFLLGESHRGGDPVVIVNRSFVERHLPGGSAVGSRIRLGRQDTGQPWLRIVGVAPDLFEGVGQFGGGQQLREAIYLPLAQSDPRFVSVAVRTGGAPEAALGQLRSAATAVDPNLPLYWVMPMDQALDQATFLYRIFGVLFVVFGGASLFLASVGLYGVIDFSVSSRMREMGLRMALGAEGRAVLGLVFRRVLAQLAVGVAVGLGIGLALGRPMAATLVGVRAWDPVVYATIVGTMTATAVMAALMPALRAVRIDPVSALRA
jgi:predicted permease